LSLSDLEPALPRPELALVGLLPTALLHNALGRLVIVEWEIQIEVKMIPDRLPHPSPMERIDIARGLRTSLLSASTAVPPRGRSRRSCRYLGRRAEGTLRLALCAIPRAGRYFTQTDTVHMGRGIATVAQKEDILVICLATYRTRLEIGEVVFGILDDHRRVDVSDLSPVLDGI
jgi:hypothetical protein